MNTKIVFDLSKAMDKSKLVKVQRPVTKAGKTFMQNFWVSPNQVKDTDRILHNRGLYDAHKAAQDLVKDRNASAKTKLDVNKFNNFKDNKDRDTAIQYAKSCGVIWSEHANPAINWMRVCMAVSKLSDDVSISQKNGIIELSKLDKQAFDAADGKSKVKQMVTTFGRDKTIDIAKQLGITWDEHPNSAISWMRASMAIQKYMEGKILDNLTGTPVSQLNPPSDTADTIKILSSHSERDKAMINLINSISDEEDIELFSKIGIVAEDDTARDYLKTHWQRSIKAIQEHFQPITNTWEVALINVKCKKNWQRICQNLLRVCL